MAAPNGRLATSDLTRIPARHYTHPEPTYLRADAAASFFRVAALYEARFGQPMRSISFYRTYQRQVEIFLQRYTKRPSGITRKQHRTDRVWQGRVWKLRAGFAVSATPGLSNHGYGLAMDLTDGLNVRASEKHRWWASIARDHGWTIRYDIGEPWHAEYNPAHDRHRGTAPKAVPAAEAVEGVATTQQQLAALGYDPGPVDGKLGDRAKAAVQAFQTDAGLTPDGIPGPATRKAIDTMASTLEQILTEVRRIRPDIATVHTSVLATPERTLRATVERAGGRMEGRTSLAGMLAWNDNHQIQLLEAIQSAAQAAGVSDAQLQQITDAVARVTAEQVASELTITTRED